MNLITIHSLQKKLQNSMPSLIFKRKQEGIEGVVVVVCEERPRNRTESVVVKANSSLLPDLENPN